METTKTLLGLLSQLQTMEAKFASVLLESALKLMTLTEANIFILIEAEDSRRYYGGKEYLCEQFRKGALQPTDADVEMEADVNITSLSPKREKPSSGLSTNWDLVAHATQHPPSSFSAALPGGEALASTTSVKMLSGKRKIPTDKQTGLDAKFPKLEVRDKEVTCEIKEEIVEVSGVKTLVDGPSVVEYNGVVDGLGGVVDGLGGAEDGQSGAGEDDDDVVLVEDLPGDNRKEFDFPPWIMEQLQNDSTALKKLDAVQNFTNPDILQEKDSVERKIVLSLFYSLGSPFASHFLQSNDKNSRNSIFQQVWALFPNLRPYATMKIPRNDGSLATLISRCKDSFFCSYRGKKFKAMRESK